MKKYTAILSKTAQKQLNKLSDKVAQPLLHAIAKLEENPRPVGYIKLKNRSSNRIRVGVYRIIYEIVDEILLIEIIAVDHRKDIYNQ